MSDHPILKDIELADLRLWRDDRVVSRHDYLKPSRGPCLAVIDAGGSIGVGWSPLLEVFHGKGSYVLSQVLLIQKASVDPCAAKLLANTLQYADGPLYRQAASVAVVAKGNSSLAMLMDRLGAKTEAVDPDKLDVISKYQSLIVDGSYPLKPEQVSQVIEFARAGGNVVLHGLTLETAPAWAEALGHRLELREVNDYYKGRAIRDRWDTLLQGLSMQDLFWHQTAGGDGTGFDLQNRLAELAKYEVVTDSPGAVNCTYPSVFLSVPVGDGKILFDQTNWDTAGDMVGNFARRIASVLVTNLGGDFTPVALARKINGPLAYVPIDLSKFANRPMADEIADDGEGGWSDQGSRIDGREFPTGRVTIQGIPFFIGGPKEVKPTEKSVIVLNGDRFKKLCLEVKGIPIGLKAETLEFLHTCAWCSESTPIFSYIVNYEGGDFEEIRVVGGININDWWLPTGDREFLNEMPGITTRVGLVGENPTFEAAGLYLMQWINPHPERKITTIDLIYRCHPQSHAAPILLGVTAGVKADADTTCQGVTGDAAKAKTLTDQAEQLMAKMQYDQAEGLLKQATAADPNSGRAFFMLGRTYRLSNKLPEATKVYRLAAGLLPESTEVLNELAEMLETQGKKIQASAVYRQSLRVNWNQPPVLNALDRLK
ncbi:MAG: hypothetical protein HQ546_09925 [Planctomycetes bacterium]|nr:hypothetical protein [Planctomycetota bacterium]